MKRMFVWPILAAVAIFGLNGETWARSKAVQVTVKNYTAGQPFSPIACVVHEPSFSLFQVGEPANDAVESIAEDAFTGDIENLVAAEPGAKMLVVGAAPILPGGSDTVVVEMDRKDVVSCIWMLVNTNDTFAGISGVDRPKKKQPSKFHPIALDAGTEVNDEAAANIPGPCCNNPFEGTDEDGLVLGSPGIAGTGDLTQVHDWRGPVAAVVVAR